MICITGVDRRQGQFYLFSQRRFLPFFTTQFLGALNDNLFKNALLVIIVSRGVSEAATNTNFLTNLAAGLFILPYFLFSTTAGQLADKYDKAWLIRRIKFAEIIIMLVGYYALYSGNIALMMFILFALGVQSSFFGPIKYSIIPQHLSPEELMAGNAQVGMGTFVSILLGTLLGGWLVTFPLGPIWVASLAIVVSLVPDPRCPSR
jgi:MFS family permease